MFNLSNKKEGQYKMEKSITNSSLQKTLSKALLKISNGEPCDVEQIKMFNSGASVLLRSIKLDIYGAQALGVPMLQRTKDFLELDNEAK